MRRFVFFLTVLTNLTGLALAPSPALAATPTVAITPSYVIEGGLLRVTGTGFTPSSNLTIRMSTYFHDPSADSGVCAENPGDVCEWPTSSDSTGAVDLKIAMPGGLSGAFAVAVEDAAASQTVTRRGQTLRPAMRLTLSDNTPARGQTVKISIGGTHPGHTVRLAVDTQANRFLTVRTSSTGRAFATYTVPRQATGRHAFIVTDPVNGQKAAVPFTIH